MFNNNCLFVGIFPIVDPKQWPQVEKKNHEKSQSNPTNFPTHFFFHLAIPHPKGASREKKSAAPPPAAAAAPVAALGAQTPRAAAVVRDAVSSSATVWAPSGAMKG